MYSFEILAQAIMALPGQRWRMPSIIEDCGAKKPQNRLFTSISTFLRHEGRKLETHHILVDSDIVYHNLLKFL